jgi:WD40-like Beta Propeller Repeat
MRTPLIALGCAVAALGMAGPAGADSLVYVRDHNVWLSNADGSGQYEVTLDGTAGSPYESPSQADDGTIVAVRTPPGGRPQLWRMRQNGQLLNAPINTPAPGTGAIDARVSPDGRLVAYWFVTTVFDPTCVFCVDVSSRALISHSDSFTPPDAVGTPNTGSLPSWMSNDEILLSNGNATQWFYKLGMTEGAEWFEDTDNCGCGAPVGLTDGEVSRDGTRLALVRGDHQETIVVYQSSGIPPPPPATPTVPVPKCEFTGPTGKFLGPTWSQDGQTLAWQEDDGIWSDALTDLSTCAGTPHLVVAGATEPDFGPAPVNPGARPACGNPGNPAACAPPPCTTCTPPPCTSCGGSTLATKLRSFLAAEARALGKLRIRGLLKKRKVKVAFAAPSAGTLTLGAGVVGGRLTFAAAGRKTAVLKLTSKGAKRLRHARRIRLTLTARFAPRGGTAVSATRKLTLKR